MKTMMELIAEIRERPHMMLGRPSARDLYAYLSGFCYARKDQGVGDYQFLGDFGQFVHDRFRVHSSQSWAQIIQFYSATEPGEMELFWKLYDEFLAKKTKKRKKAS